MLKPQSTPTESAIPDYGFGLRLHGVTLEQAREQVIKADRDAFRESVLASSCKTPKAKALARVPPPEKLKPIAVSALSRRATGPTAGWGAAKASSVSAELIGAFRRPNPAHAVSASAPPRQATDAAKRHDR